jgi:hypothetical protein
MHSQHNAEGHLPGLGESLIIPPIAGRVSGLAGSGFEVAQDYPLENGLSPAHIPGMNGQLREYLINGAMILAVLLVVYGFVHFYGYPSQTP